jgi:hypothetical protein
LQLASIKEVVEAPQDGDAKTDRFVQGQKQIMEWTESLLASFVEKEELASQYSHVKTDEILYKRYHALVHELLSGYGSMDVEHLQQMAWINPVLLGSCIRTKNEDIRLVVQKLVARLSPVAAQPSLAVQPVPERENDPPLAIEKDASTVSATNGENGH